MPENKPRMLRPVQFFDDPRLPLEGVHDWSPHPKKVEKDQQPPQGRDPSSSVYGGKRAPSSGEPVVMDPKEPVGKSDKASKSSGGPPDVPTDPQTPTPQTSEPTNAEVAPSPQSKKTSGDSASKSSNRGQSTTKKP